MTDSISSQQREALFKIFDQTMAVMRDDTRFDPDDGKFGTLRSTRKQQGGQGVEYKFQVIGLSAAHLTVFTASAPRENSCKEMTAVVVPEYFSIRFDPSISGIDRTTIERRLDLAMFWVDSNGEQYEGNELLPRIPPNTRVHAYRYRANAHDASWFAVDVELYLVDPPDNELGRVGQKLDEVIVRRVYPAVSPKIRKGNADNPNAECLGGGVI
ncbi:hypothetical protein [Paraburkholderia bannensis]|uniref:hypothetical protein n=1 Tax=Paraburkholderia bannensis TaxID=765414 RepID=UPI002AB6DD7C|nr:hypothetical protein [Paraburkholderia bannensis]